MLDHNTNTDTWIVDIDGDGHIAFPSLPEAAVWAAEQAHARSAGFDVPQPLAIRHHHSIGGLPREQ